MKLFLPAVLLIGCSGPAFTTGFAADSIDPFEGDAGIAAGGAPGETGGTPESGGKPGRPSEGGDPGAGGASDGGVTAGGAAGAPESSGGASAGGALPCDPVIHDDGLGDVWQDCMPLGTLDLLEARAACSAWSATTAGGCSFHSDLCPNVPDMLLYGAAPGAIFGWAASGDVYQPIAPSYQDCTVIGIWQ